MVKQASVRLALTKQKTMTKQGTYGSMGRTAGTTPVSRKGSLSSTPGAVNGDEEDEDGPPVVTMTRTMTRTKSVVSRIRSEGLTTEFAEELLKKFGRNELPEKKKPKWLIVRICVGKEGGR